MTPHSMRPAHHHKDEPAAGGRRTKGASIADCGSQIADCAELGAARDATNVCQIALALRRGSP
jgi:hypothetical protein